MAKYLVFIGYRRTDSGGEAARIRYHLAERFGAARIFKDQHLLTAGTGGATRDAMAETRTYLALIGPSWFAALKDDIANRVHNHMTYELELALANPKVRVVPVLVNGARLPPNAELPPAIAALSALNAAQLRPDPDFHNDLDRLAEVLAFDEPEAAANPTPAMAPGAATDMPRIFLSHSTRDGADPGAAIAGALEARGAACWIAPRDVLAGQLYPGQIVRAIEACRALVLVLTPEANESPDVLQEVQIAHSARKPIAPVIVAGTVPCADIRYFITVRHHINWTNGDTVADRLLATFSGG